MAELTPLLLKQKVELVLSGVIGTYTYPKGYQSPACSVGNPADNSIKVDGVEVIVPLVPNIGKSNFVGGDVHQDQLWDLMLIQRSGVNLGTCVARLTRYFTNSRAQYVPQNDVLKTYAQCRLTVYHYDLFPAYRY